MSLRKKTSEFVDKWAIGIFAGSCILPISLVSLVSAAAPALYRNHIVPEVKPSIENWQHLESLADKDNSGNLDIEEVVDIYRRAEVTYDKTVYATIGKPFPNNPLYEMDVLRTINSFEKENSK